MALTVESLRRRRDIREFLSLDPRLYANDRDWVPPLRAVLGARLLAQHPLDDDRRFRLLVARRDGAVVARCAVFRDPAHDKHKNENVCFFGYFEAEDPESGRAVLDAARALARDWGADLIRGPRGITRIDQRGVLVEGHHIAPMMAGHHPAWYADLLDELGFEKDHDALAYEIAVSLPDGSPRPLPDTLARKAASVDIPGLEVRPTDWRAILRDVDLAHAVMVEGFRDVPDNTPISRGLFRSFAIPFLGVTHPQMMQLATVNGAPAGFALCFPELNEALRHAGGRLGPRGVVGFATSLREIRTASFKLLGVVPEYRGTGIHALLIQRAIEGIRSVGYDRLEASLIDERNGPMRHIVEDAGMTVYRRYRVFERPV